MIIKLNEDEADAIGLAPGSYQSGLQEFTTRHTCDHHGDRAIHTLQVYQMNPLVEKPLNDLGVEAKELAEEKGFGSEDTQAMSAMRIALMHSELSEMLEAVREAGTPNSLGRDDQGNVRSEKVPEITLEAEEAADLFIRLAQYCAIRGIDLDRAVQLKHEFNKTRPIKHGKNF